LIKAVGIKFSLYDKDCIAFLYTIYTWEFYAKRFSIKASLGQQQGNVGIKFCHYTARNVWHKILPLYSTAKTGRTLSLNLTDKISGGFWRFLGQVHFFINFTDTHQQNWGFLGL